MNHTLPGQSAQLSLAYGNGTLKNASVILGTGSRGQGQHRHLYFLSDNSMGIMTGEFAQGYLNGLKNMPFSAPGWLRAMILPVLQFSGDDMGFSAFQGEFSSLYHPVGWAAPFGSLVFNIAECLFWIGWLNFNVGLFNCLPMIPLDGGHIFREVTRTLMGGFIKDQDKAERISKAIVNGFAVTLLASIYLHVHGALLRAVVLHQTRRAASPIPPGSIIYFRTPLHGHRHVAGGPVSVIVAFEVCRHHCIRTAPFRVR